MMVNDHVQDLLFTGSRKKLSPYQWVGGGVAYQGVPGVIAPCQGTPRLNETQAKFNRVLQRECTVAARSVARIRKFGMFSQRKSTISPRALPMWFQVVAQIANFKARYKLNLCRRVSYSQVLRKVKRWQNHLHQGNHEQGEIQLVADAEEDLSLEDLSDCELT